MLVTVGTARAAALRAPRSVDAAATELASIADELRSQARSVLHRPQFWGERFARPQLVPVTHQQAADVTADTLDLFARRADGGWKDDDLCFPRALLAAGRIERLLAGRIAGPDEASHAAIAVAHFPFKNLRGAGHHAAPLLQADDGQRLIVDWRMFPERGIGTFEEWQRVLDVKPGQVAVQRVLDNAPLGAGRAYTRPTTRAVVSYAEREVVGSLRRFGNVSPLDDASRPRPPARG